MEDNLKLSRNKWQVNRKKKGFHQQKETRGEIKKMMLKIREILPKTLI
jgi:hypothetical protein